MLEGNLQCERAARLTEYINLLYVGCPLSTNEYFEYKLFIKSSKCFDGETWLYSALCGVIIIQGKVLFNPTGTFSKRGKCSML